MKKQKRKTIYDIAKEAEVSVATVSRVLTGKNVVKQDTRARVLKAIKNNDYVPNPFARSLSTRESKMLGCVFPDITNPFYSILFSELEKISQKEGYTIIYGNSLSNLDMESHYLKIFEQKRVDGIFIAGGRVNEANLNTVYIEELIKLQLSIPVVAINGGIEDYTYSVIVDEVDGVMKIVEYLYSLGHTDIGFIGGIKGITACDFKVKAFKDSIRNLKLKYNSKWDIRDGFSLEAGCKCMEKLLKNKKMPTAVLCINDLVAIGAIATLQNKSYSVPEFMSIVGFDDIAYTEILNPSISTVSQNYSILAYQSFEKMKMLFKGEKPERKTLVNSIFIPRNSISKPKKFSG